MSPGHALLKGIVVPWTWFLQVRFLKYQFFRTLLSTHNLLVSEEWWESWGKLQYDLTTSKILGVPWTCFVFDKYIKNYFSIILNINLFVTLCSTNDKKKIFIDWNVYFQNCFKKIHEVKCPLDMVLYMIL